MDILEVLVSNSFEFDVITFKASFLPLFLGTLHLNLEDFDLWCPPAFQICYNLEDQGKFFDCIKNHVWEQFGSFVKV